MPFATSPNISRFPYSSPFRRSALHVDLTDRRAQYLDRLPGMLAEANGAVAAEAARLIAQTRADRLRQQGKPVTSDTVVIIDAGDAPTSTATLGDCFPDGDNDPDYADAIDALTRTGTFVGGGGAAPVYRLTLVRE